MAALPDMHGERATTPAAQGFSHGEPLTVELASPTDWAGFVHAARWLVQQGRPPEAVAWRCAGESLGGHVASADLFDTGAATSAATLPTAPALNLPTDWVATARRAALNADADRHALLYRLAWRIHQQRDVAFDPLDADGRRMGHLARAVQCEAHKMKAFVRFRPVVDGAGEAGTERHIAWFEPTHHVQEWVAPFFAQRFANMRWAILTPRVSVLWDRQALQFGPGARREQAPAADAGEALWLAYYASIFNPARVKVAAMRKEMPVRYWANLPEAQLIAPLLAEAAQRTQGMLDGAVQAGPRTRRRGQPAAGRPLKPSPSGR